MEQQPNPKPFARKPQAPIFDQLTWIILGLFLLFSIVLFVRGYHGYWITSRQIASRNAMQNEQWDKALPKLIDLSKDKRADRFTAMRNVVICYLGLEKPDEALAWLGKWTAEDKGAVTGELYGRAYFQKKDYKKAMEYFNPILARNPFDPAANFYTGVIFFHEGRMAEAGQRFARAASDPKFDEKARPYREQMLKRLQAGDAATTATTPAK